ncbi:hypothetical protein BGZ70_005094 [Mortierella alpina]|uniref:Uncharacterized protein n=1 Tax=Mortierella alpina TaxID=64518 RepID=A0A9P6J997_MORAP|nr:hypothetical protein BGZ70_005094 [Mortierella alpina]
MSSRYPPQSRMPSLVPQRTETLWYPRQMGVEHMHDELLQEEAAYESSNDDDDEEEDEEEEEDDEDDLDRAHDLDADLSQDGYDPAEEAELDLDVDLDLDHDLDPNNQYNNNNNNNDDDDNDDPSQDLNPLGSGGIHPYPGSSTLSTDMDHHQHQQHHDHRFYSAPIEPDSELDLDRDLDGDVSEASSHGAELYSPRQHSPHYSP